MSPRNKRIRKILRPPALKSLTPKSRGCKSVNVEPVMLLLEEFEAIKLCDYDLINHNEASVLMGVSRPTFTRIYSSARKKVATAFVEIREIIVEGGKVCYDSDWFQCDNCGCDFNHNNKTVLPTKCPLCGNSKISNIVT